MSRAEDHLTALLVAAAQDGAVSEDLRAIAHGAQARVRLGDQKGVLRVYDGKRGLRVDDSQLPEGPLSECVVRAQGRLFARPAAGPTQTKGSVGGAPSPARPALGGDTTTRIGTDESGKGDYFGPLVVAGVLVPGERRAEVDAWGVRDSKTLSDHACRQLSERITENFPTGLWLLEGPAYNERHRAVPNLNRILAEGHAAVIEDILAKGHACQEALTDKFGDERLVQNALGQRGRGIHLTQVVRAEADTAVAAASVVARAMFLDRLDALSEEWGVPLHKGAGSPTDRAGRAFVRLHGAEAMGRVAKLHFKNTQKILGR